MRSTSDEWGYLHARASTDASRRAACEARRRAAEPKKHGGGRPTMWRRRAIILQLADIYERRTGKRATTTRDGPFFMFVKEYIWENARELSRRDDTLLQAIKRAFKEGD